MKTSIKTLRSVIQETLLIEAFEGMQLATIKRNDQVLWALIRHGVVTAGMVTKPHADGWDTVEKLWANDKTSAYAIVMSALASVASKGLIPSNDVSPAAQAIIKRWFNSHENDPRYIEHDVVNNDDKPFLNAGYKRGPNVKNVAASVTINNDEDRREIEGAVLGGFARAYDDVKKTKLDKALNDALAREDWSALTELCYKFIFSMSGDTSFIRSWLMDNLTDITMAMHDSGYDSDEWDDVLKRLKLY